MVLTDILPKDTKTYDKNRPPKYSGQPTVVNISIYICKTQKIYKTFFFFLEGIFPRNGSINRHHQRRINGILLSLIRVENIILFCDSIPDIRRGYFSGTKLEGSSLTFTGKHDIRIPVRRLLRFGFFMER